MKGICVAILLLTVGCGGDQECRETSGKYRLDQRVISDSCGIAKPLTSVVDFDNPEPDDPRCSYRTTVTDENCGVEVDGTCGLDDGGTLTVAGKATWETDASHGVSIVTLTWRFPDKTCVATVEMTYSRL